MNKLFTERLLIEELSYTDNKFILELVNSEGWLNFIGNRNINSEPEAYKYIQKIIDNPNVEYFVIKLKELLTPIGIVTYIKRDYLEYYDIGFAFLPNFENYGYAYESTKAILKSLVQKYNLSYIFAVTKSDNINSIKLLEKLRLSFEKEIEVDRIKLQLYGASTNNL